MLMQAVVFLRDLLSHDALLPAAGGVLTGATFALSRSPVRPFGIRESESLMNFSSLGTLRCICGPTHSESSGLDRREFCRSCGFEVVPVDEAWLKVEMSKAEVRRKTRELRQAAIRAAHLELPASITSVLELQQYLSSDVTKVLRSSAGSQSTVEQPQV